MPDARVELLCGHLPPDPTQAQQDLWDDTVAMHERAQAVADAAEVADAFTTHEEGDGEYADAYLYPSLALLPSTLDALDEAGVEYDYVDLPADAPGALAEDLRSRFKGTGVSVTGGPRGQNPVAAAKARLLAW